jgi:hypothetical protein
MGERILLIGCRRFRIPASFQILPMIELGDILKPNRVGFYLHRSALLYFGSSTHAYNRQEEKRNVCSHRPQLLILISPVKPWFVRSSSSTLPNEDEVGSRLNV